MIGLFKKLISLVVLLVLIGCGKHEPKTKLLLDWWPNPNHIPLYVGLEKGIFTKYGLDIEILSLQDPPDAVTYLRTNQADIAIYYLPLTLRTFAKEPSISVVGKLMEEPLQGFMCRDDGSINEIRDFDGKTLGAFPDGMTVAYKEQMEKKHGFKFKEMKHVQFDVAAALYAKTIDIISGVFWNIEPEQLRANGVQTKTFKFSEFGLPSYPELVFLGSEKFRKEHPEKARAFKAAIQEAIDYCVAHQEEAFSVYMAANPDKSTLTKEWERKAWALTAPALAKDQVLDLDEVQAFHDWMLDHKLIEGPCALDQLEFDHAI